jgi:hypothetical protein
LDPMDSEYLHYLVCFLLIKIRHGVQHELCYRLVASPRAPSKCQDVSREGARLALSRTLE